MSFWIRNTACTCRISFQSVRRVSAFARFDAITVGKPPALDSEKCEICLACLPACPVGAYRADDDVADLLTCATHIEDQPVELLCGLHPHPETGAGAESIGIQIRGCLAGLGTGALLTLSALGLKRLALRTDACSACNWHSLHSEIHLQAERASRFLSAWEMTSPSPVWIRSQSPVERPLWSSKESPAFTPRLVPHDGKAGTSRPCARNGKRRDRIQAPAWARPIAIVVLLRFRMLSNLQIKLLHSSQTSRIWICLADDFNRLHRLWRMWTSLSHRGTVLQEERRGDDLLSDLLGAELHRL